MTSENEVEILLIEDDPNDRELTLRALRGRNLANRVRVARDGAEALLLLLGNEDNGMEPVEIMEPRVVLLDLKLPKVDGLEVLRRVKANERTRHIPVVVLTSSRESPDVHAAYQLGANSYIVKPVDFESFSRAVTEVGLYWVLRNQPPVREP